MYVHKDVYIHLHIYCLIGLAVSVSYNGALPQRGLYARPRTFHLALVYIIYLADFTSFHCACPYVKFRVSSISNLPYVPSLPLSVLFASFLNTIHAG